MCVSDAKGKEQRGTSYIRWGRKTCENNSTLVYKGTSVIVQIVLHERLMELPT